MAEEDQIISLFRQAQALRDKELIADVIQIVRDCSENWGRWPTVTEVLKLLALPS